MVTPGRLIHRMTQLLPSIQRRNPEHDFQLIKLIGSGTFGEVYKVSGSHDLALVKHILKVNSVHLLYCVCVCVCVCACVRMCVHACVRVCGHFCL